MSFLAKLFAASRSSASYHPSDSRLGALFGWPTTAAGKAVTPETALSLSGVFAAVRLISRVKAALPLSVFRQRARGGRDHATDLGVYRLLRTAPNPEMTSIVFRQTLEWNRLLHGAACAEIERRGDGSPLALWPIEGWRVVPDRDTEGTLFYRVDGKRVAAEKMIYVPLVSEDGVTGRSFIEYARESLGSGLAAQDFAARYFGNDARPGGILEHIGTPPEPARKEMRESWTREHGGSSNSHKVAVLWGGWKFNQAGGSTAPNDAQLLESRVFAIQEVARWIGIPPHLLAELSRATFSNIEEQNLNFLILSLMPTLVEYEQEYDRRLLGAPDLFTKHNANALMRGNMAARSAFYRELFGIGVFSPNDVLELEDMNPIGPAGDRRFVPLNMATLDEVSATTPTEPADGQAVEKKPLDSLDAAAGQGDVQATALNGAQITSLVAIAVAVVEGQLPAEGARAMIQASFPLMKPELVDKLIKELDAFEPEAKPAPPMFGPPKPPGQVEDPPAGDEAEAEETEQAEEDAPAAVRRAAAITAHRAVIVDAVGRLVRREAQAARRAAKHPVRFLARIDEFYGPHEELVRSSILPALRAHVSLCPKQEDPEALAEAVARAHVAKSRAELLDVAGASTAATLEANVETLCKQWEITRAANLADAFMQEEIRHAA